MSRKKILLIIPPYIPSYFNAGHNLPLFSCSAYLRKKFPDMEVTAIDAAALNFTWKEICDLLIPGFDFIFLMNDFDGVDTFDRFIKYCRKLSPASKLCTFGRLSNQIPGFFKKMDLDGVVSSGDYESGIESFITFYLHDNRDIPGLYIKTSHSEFSNTGKGRFLSPEDWVLPDIKEIPYSAYDFLYKNDFNKFCGIPDRRELVIPIARGCPVGCAYCDVPIMQGKKERRISVQRTVDYIINSFKEEKFDYYSFYCPTFTLDRKWVEDFCKCMISNGFSYPWKCVTVLSFLSYELIDLMREAGCIRISIGLETLDSSAIKTLPKVKQKANDELEGIARACNTLNIELNCFVILGLPGDSIEGVAYTIEKIISLGARVRPTIYTPYHDLNDITTLNEVNGYNRQLFTGVIDPSLEIEYYKLFYANENDRKTEVMKNITKRKTLGCATS